MFLKRGLVGRAFAGGMLIFCSLGAGCDKVAPSGQPFGVNSVYPLSGPSGGGGELVIQGTGFRPGAAVTLDGVPTSATLQGTSYLRTTAPPHAEGPVDIVVTNPGGASARLPGAYTYVPLVVTRVSPAGALTGEPAQISGTGFVSGSTVTLGGVNARVIAFNPVALNIAIPPHPPETVDVVVTNPSGESATLPSGFAFAVVAVTAGPSVLAAGDRLTVSWSAPPSRPTLGGGDWLLLVKVGTPDSVNSGNWFDHLQGESSGTLTLAAPTQPGQYEFRYMVEGTAVARSNPVTVIAGG